MVILIEKVTHVIVNYIKEIVAGGQIGGQIECSKSF